MDEQKAAELHRRNRSITDAVLARAQQLCPDALERISLAPAEPLPAGTYEEAVSNWRGKIRHAARTDNGFLSLMSAASCGWFYEEMADAYGVPCCLPFDGNARQSPREAELAFDAALTAYEAICRERGRNPVRYNGTEERMRRYGCGE